MGKYLKLFETHSQYESFTQTEDFLLPNVSYCEDQVDVVHYNPIAPQETRLMVTYNVEDASQPTYIYGYYAEGGIFGVNMFDKVEIDETDVSVSSLDAAEGMYQLSVGEHTIAYTLKDPTTIANEAFYGCASVVNVEIPNSVTSIGQSVFVDCSALTSVTIGSGVTSIDESVFVNCSSLTSIDIPIGVTSISGSTFQNCSGLTSITIPDSVISIGESAFYNCSSLTSCTIGSGVTSIGDNAFYLCSGLTSIVIPNSVTSIGNNAFRGCSGLTSVTIGNSVASIGDESFCDCPLDAESAAAIEAINPNATECTR